MSCGSPIRTPRTIDVERSPLWRFCPQTLLLAAGFFDPAQSWAAEPSSNLQPQSSSSRSGDCSRRLPSTLSPTTGPWWPHPNDGGQLPRRSVGANGGRRGRNRGRLWIPRPAPLLHLISMPVRPVPAKDRLFSAPPGKRPTPAVSLRSIPSCRGQRTGGLGHRGHGQRRAAIPRAFSPATGRATIAIGSPTVTAGRATGRTVTGHRRRAQLMAVAENSPRLSTRRKGDDTLEPANRV